MKVAINACFGGFGLSPEALLRLWERGVKEIGTPINEYWGESLADDSVFGLKKSIGEWREYLKTGSHDGLHLTVFSPDEKYVLSADIDRAHPELIKIIEEMGNKANGFCASLSIVEIPDGVDYHIEEYDGNEHVAENHRTWR